MRYEFPPSFDLCAYSKVVAEDDDTLLMQTVLKDLWMQNRSLISDGYDASLEYLSKHLPMNVLTAETGKELWTWPVPKKWKITQAWIKYKGETIVDFKNHPLHVVSYSTPFQGTVTKEELLQHLHFNTDRPNAIPYVYRYYKADWGFCMSYNQYKKLPDGPFEVMMDTALEDGHLKVGEGVLEGQNGKSIILCGHLCHPGQVNDGLSGVAVGLALMRRLSKLKNRRYTYRLIFCPENVGSLAYLHLRQDQIESFKYGMFLEMLGNKNHIKIQESKHGNTEIDRIAEYVVSKNTKVYGMGRFRKVICNDEINFDGPGINIPCISVTRWPYPEYHTSDDCPDNISPNYLKESLELCWQMIERLEKNVYPKRKYRGNVMLGRYGLYEDLNADDTVEQIMLAFEGNLSVLEISEKLKLPMERVEDYVRRFYEAGLITLEENPS